MSTDDDPKAQQLREAVWADPASDDVRMVYADYLLEQGDPLGELIALQLERARTGAAPSSREWELLQSLGRRPAAPIERYLGLFTLERGFLENAMPVPGIPLAVAHHPAWSTVRCVQIEAAADAPVLTNPHLRARALASREVALHELSSRSQPFPFHSLTAINPSSGLSFTPDQLGVFEHLGAFDRVRAISLNARGFEDLPHEPSVLESRLCRQLEHLDLTFTSVRPDDLHMWLCWFATSKLQRITFQIPLGESDPSSSMFPYANAATHYTTFMLDRDRMIIQLVQPTEAPHVDALLRAASVLGADTARVEVHDLGDSNHIAVRQALALDRLRDSFGDVHPVTGPVCPLAP